MSESTTTTARAALLLAFAIAHVGCIGPEATMAADDAGDIDGEVPADGAVTDGAPALDASDAGATDAATCSFTGTPSCNACATQWCCAEEIACEHDSACQQSLDCIRACQGDATCKQGCYASGPATLNALSACISNRCFSACL